MNEQQAKYTDSLERQRYKEQLAAQKYMQEEDRKKNEESMLRIEAQKRATLEAELRNRRQAEKDRVAAETEGRIAEERANHDLHMNKIRLEATDILYPTLWPTLSPWLTRRTRSQPEWPLTSRQASSAKCRA